MFDGIAARYDLLNRLLSLGLDRRWRRRAVREMAPRGGERYLDVGCGTGDVTLEALRQAPAARVVGLDPARGMLALAAAQAQAAGPSGCPGFVMGDATRLPFADGSFDGVATAFCFRSIPQRLEALREMRRVLAAGGRLVILETGVPRHPLVRLGHWLYTHSAVPLLGWLLAGNARAYRYLTDSTEALPVPERVVAMLEQAGFAEARARVLMLGAVTLYTGRAPQAG